MKNFNYISINESIIKTDKACISPLNISFTYGFGVYETLRIRKGKIYFLNEHVQRLIHSAKVINLPHRFDKDFIDKQMQQLLEKNNINSTDFCNVKMLLIGGKTAKEATLYIFLLRPLYPDKDIYKKGVSVITTEYERPFPQSKTLSMLPSYIAYTKAKKLNCYDSLLINKDKFVLEGTRSNFFTIKNKAIYTAPKKYILSGVTRKHLLQIAEKNGFQVKEQLISLKKLDEYDGAFLTSTSSKVMPIKKIDTLIYQSISEEIKQLIKLYNDFLKK